MRRLTATLIIQVPIPLLRRVEVDEDGRCILAPIELAHEDLHAFGQQYQ